MPGIWKPDEELAFAAAFKRLAVMFDRRVTDELVDLYREELGDMDGDMVVTGMHACLKECRFWPSVAEIRTRSGSDNVAEMQRRIEHRMDNGHRLDEGNGTERGRLG